MQDVAFYHELIIIIVNATIKNSKQKQKKSEIRWQSEDFWKSFSFDKKV